MANLYRPVTLNTLLFVLLALSASVNVALALRLNGAEVTPLVSGLTIGTRVELFTVIDDRNREMVVRLADSPKSTLLYVLSPTCKWCERNVEGMKALIKQAAGRYNVWVISLPAQETELASYRQITPVYVATAPSIAALRLRPTPQTLLFSKAGVLRENWRGAYTGAVRLNIAASLGIELPELTETPPAAASSENRAPF